VPEAKSTLNFGFEKRQCSEHNIFSAKEIIIIIIIKA
jgi:hypothetical protein